MKFKRIGSCGVTDVKTLQSLKTVACF